MSGKHDTYHIGSIGNLTGNLGKAVDVPPNRITESLAGKRGITAETAIKLGRSFGNSPQFWMNLQVGHDAAVAQQEINT